VAVDISVLGPLQVEVDGQVVSIGSAKERALLAWLALVGRGGRSAGEIIDALWGADPPRSAHKAVQTYVSSLRRALSHPVIRTTSHGYALDLPRESVDAARFEALAARGRLLIQQGERTAGAATLSDALKLWRGPALVDLRNQMPGMAEAARLEELRRGVAEDLVDARLANGEHHEMVADLQAAVDEEPLRERRWAQLMVALYRTGRQADALRAFRLLQRRLADELGIDPSAELSALEDAILHQKPELSAWGATEHRAPRPLASLALDPVDPYVAGRRRDAGLPSPVSSFIGRDRERAAVGELLRDHRLVTLTGSGGCGKTRLAIAVVEPLVEEGWVPHYVELETVTDPAHAPAAFAAALAMPDPHRADVDGVVRFASTAMSEGRHILVVDNAEHLLEAAATVVARLLRAYANPRVLVTSRERLRIAGEQVFVVPGLSVPGDGSGLSTAAEAVVSDSVRLFTERAGLAHRTLEEDAIRTMARICRDLDGIPLAIELAASAATTLPLGELERRLQLHLDEIGDQRGAVPRHRTLAAAMRWSFSSLNPAEGQLLVALAVFAASFSLDAALAVAGGTVPDVPFTLAALVRKSLVTPLGGQSGIHRYQLLSTIKHLVVTELGTPEALDAARRAHAAYFRRLVEEADHDVHGPRGPERLGQVGGELPDLRAALRYSIAEGDLEAGAELAGSLRWFFGRLCLLDECQQWLAAVLARRSELRPLVRVRLLSSAGTLAFTTGQLHGAPELTEEAVNLALALDDASELAVAWTVRGGVLAYAGQLPQALACFEAAEPLCRNLGDRYCLGWLLTERAVALRRLGEVRKAHECLHEALDQFAGMGDTHSMIMPTLHIGLATQQMGRLDEAADWCARAVTLCRQIGDRQLLHLSLCCSGRVALDCGDLGAAAGQICFALGELADAENMLALAIGIEGLAIIAARCGSHRDAVALWAFADSVRRRTMLALSPDRMAERSAWLSDAAAQLTDAGVALAWDTGAALSRDEAVALGTSATGTVGAERRSSGH